MKNMITISMVATIMLSGCNGKTTCEDTIITDTIKQNLIKKLQDNKTNLEQVSDEYRQYFTPDDDININTLEINSKNATDMGIQYVAESFMNIIGGDEALVCSYTIKDTSANKYVQYIDKQDASYHKLTDSDAAATYGFVCISSKERCFLMGQ